jgi:hypothetical protein
MLILLENTGLVLSVAPPCDSLSKTYCEYSDKLSEREAIDTLLAENGIDPGECTIIPMNPAHL